jgi:hypothetical protein
MVGESEEHLICLPLRMNTQRKKARGSDLESSPFEVAL